MSFSPDSDRILRAAPHLGPKRMSARTRRLTKTLGSGLALISGFPDKMTTFLHVIPIEAPCHAVRLGFANCYNSATTITKASIFPSDSYSVLTDHDHRGLNDTAYSTDYAVAPTGSAPGSQVYFDNGGADVFAIKAGGTTRGFTLPAIEANPNNARQGFTIQWSDLTPVQSISRKDGAPQHLLFVYVTIGSGNMTAPYLGKAGVFNASSGNRGRYFWTGRASRPGHDYADNPTHTNFKQFAIAPLFCIQYLTASKGTQIVLSGDSLSAGPTDDNYSTPLHRAGWDLSTPDAPIEVASLAWGGTASEVYYPMLANNAAALRPSVVAYQPLSRNDGSTLKAMQTLIAKAMASAETLRYLYGATAILNSPGCQPSFDGNPAAITAFTEIRARLAAISSAGDIPFIDGPSIIGNVTASAPWNYSAGTSDDETHPNFAGTELLVPQSTEALLRVINGYEGSV